MTRENLPIRNGQRPNRLAPLSLDWEATRLATRYEGSFLAYFGICDSREGGP